MERKEMNNSDKRTAVLNIAIEVAKVVDHLTQATILLEKTAHRLTDLDNELRKPELSIVEEER